MRLFRLSAGPLELSFASLFALLTLSAALQALLGSLHPHPVVIADADFCGHAIAFLTNRPGVFLAERGAVDIAQLPGTLLPQHHVDPGEQVGGTGTHGLEMMLALIDHL